MTKLKIISPERNSGTDQYCFVKVVIKQKRGYYY